VILLALSVCALRSLVNVYMTELQFLDMAVNTKNLQVCVLALGIQDSVEMLLGESPVNWVTSARYLGVHRKSSVRFKCLFANNKAKFFRAFNSILGRLDVTPWRKSCLR